MPSSLVEVSFISNREEERLLKTEAYRQMLAQSIADGIHAYFSSRPAQQIVRGDGDHAAAKTISLTRGVAAR
jgi:hypothetical protein